MISRKSSASNGTKTLVLSHRFGEAEVLKEFLYAALLASTSSHLLEEGKVQSVSRLALGFTQYGQKIYQGFLDKETARGLVVFNSEVARVNWITQGRKTCHVLSRVFTFYYHDGNLRSCGKRLAPKLCPAPASVEPAMFMFMFMFSTSTCTVPKG